MQKQKTVDVLNELITVSENGHKDFAEASRIAADPALKSLYWICSQDYERGAIELRRLLDGLGSKSVSGGSAANTCGRIESAIESENQALLEEVELGHDYVKATYVRALKEDIDPLVRNVIERQAARFKRNYDLVRDVRNSCKAPA